MLARTRSKRESRLPLRGVRPSLSTVSCCPSTSRVFSGAAATEVLRSYARRAATGADDDPLVVGTSKDLLEATAAHVLQERFGSYPDSASFPGLLGQAFVALGLATTEHARQPGEPASRRVERALYETGCAINALRNKEGTGHGRPWLPSVSRSGAKAALRTMGTISDYLLDKLDEGA